MTQNTSTTNKDISKYKVSKYPQGCFSWADATVSNTSASADFYKSVLGWEVEARPVTEDINYYMFKVGGENVAGMGHIPPGMEGVPSHWMCYINVDDVDAIVEKAQALGGKVTMPAMDVMEEGRMVLIEDPTGAVVGFWQAKNHIGAGLVNTHGAMGWNELMTHDVDAAKKYYGELLGWTFDDGDESGYIVIMNNGRMNGGIFKMSDDQATMKPNWMPYFTVPSIEEVVAKVEPAGGAVHMPPTKVNAGTFAVVGDPSGAVFYLIESEQLDVWEE
jgi:predicted enzyme related to lactoylglutathione lyase